MAVGQRAGCVSLAEHLEITRWCARRGGAWWAESFSCDDGTVAVGIGAPDSEGEYAWIIDRSRAAKALTADVAVVMPSGEPFGVFGSVGEALGAIAGA